MITLPSLLLATIAQSGIDARRCRHAGSPTHYNPPDFNSATAGGARLRGE